MNIKQLRLIVACLVLASMLAALGWSRHQLNSERLVSAELRTKLAKTEADMASLKAAADAQQARLAAAEAAAKETGKAVEAKTKSLRAQPLANTLTAIQARGVSSAKEVRVLWNE